jgi:hypothetical protein
MFTGSSSMKSCYTRGTSTTASFTLLPTAKANLAAPRAIIVFDVVSRDQAGYPSVLTTVLDTNSISGTPDIFSNPLDITQLKAGLKATVSFKVKPTSILGNFSLVISAFRLQDGQRPDDVTKDLGALIGRAVYWFAVE